MSTETKEQRIERIAGFHYEQWKIRSENQTLESAFRAALTALCEEMEREKARPKDEWTEDMGDALWWYFPISEPPHVGSPLDDYFPEYVTHFTPLRLPQPPAT